MYFADLGTECQVDHGPSVRAIGWLDDQHSYPTGPVLPAFLVRLREHVREAWQPVAAAGSHECQLCRSNPAADSANIWIPGETSVYVAPALIVHYIEAHEYRLPEEFIEAVMVCPKQNSPEYLVSVGRHSYWQTVD